MYWLFGLYHSTRLHRAFLGLRLPWRLRSTVTNQNRLEYEQWSILAMNKILNVSEPVMKISMLAPLKIKKAWRTWEKKGGMSGAALLNHETQEVIKITGCKVLSETESMTFDEFMHEVGFVLTQEEMASNLEEFRKVWSLLCNAPKIEYAPKRSFADNSDEAVLTREVLKKAAEKGNPHCNRHEFKSMAFDLYLDMGFDKTTFRRAVHQYA